MPIHGPALSQISEGKISQESIQIVRSVLFGEQSEIYIGGLIPLNRPAEQNHLINSRIVGGNLSLIQYSIGTTWELNTKDKIILCEVVNEQAYRSAERIEHLKQRGLFDECCAVIFCDFTFNQDNPSELELYRYIFKKFAAETTIPVLICPGIGHGNVNTPLPIGGSCSLALGKKPSMSLNFFH